MGFAAASFSCAAAAALKPPIATPRKRMPFSSLDAEAPPRLPDICSALFTEDIVLSSEGVTAEFLPVKRAKHPSRPEHRQHGRHCARRQQ